MTIPKMEGVLLATEAAEIIGITRQSVNRMIREGQFKSARALGNGRPIFVLGTEEVAEVAKKYARTA